MRDVGSSSPYRFVTRHSVLLYNIPLFAVTKRLFISLCLASSIQGDFQPSEITGRIEAHYPSWKRNIFRYCVSLPIILTSLGVVLVTMLLCFEFQRWVDGMENPPKPLKFAPKIALAVCIGMLDDNYKKVAYHLNDKGELRFQLQSNPYQVTF